MALELHLQTGETQAWHRTTPAALPDKLSQSLLLLLPLLCRWLCYLHGGLLNATFASGFILQNGHRGILNQNVPDKENRLGAG